MIEDKDFSWVEVFDGTLLQAAMLRSMLEDSEIKVFMKDEFMGNLNPWYTAPGGAGAVSVLVPHKDLNQAKQIVEDFQNNICS